MSRFLPYLPALACPLLMLVCMAGMRRMGGAPTRTEESSPASTPDRIARLERELAALRAEQRDAAGDLDPIPTAPAPAPSHPDPPSAHPVS